ncbi:MAGE family protein [Diplocarpon rosae]|nr:MAGE family protein [Diplocarpon rosae]
MPSAARKRRAVEEEDSSDEETPANTQRRRTQAESDDESDDEADEPGNDAMGLDGGEGHSQLVKKLVRFALACEYQRRTIKRADVMEKVIGNQPRGAYKRVWDSAQKILRSKFGMEMVQLTSKEKVTIKEKRAAQKTRGNSKAPNTYILTTTLPSEYRRPEIKPASNIESEEKEASYIALCTTIVSIIALSPNDSVPNHKLISYLERLNLEVNTAFGKKDALLARMTKDGYIYKTIESTVDDEQIDWRVGARGKAEIGNNGIRGLVREVYGEEAPKDLDKRLQRSLGMEVSGPGDNGENSAAEEEEQQAGTGPSRNPSRAQSRR